jgi:hypothetical protein
MLAEFELAEVRRFTEELRVRRQTCNDEGMYCSDLDEQIGCQFDVCVALRSKLGHWVDAVFTGSIAFDPEVDALFRSEVRTAVNIARPLVDHGFEVETECYSLGRLDSLDEIVRDFESLLRNWVCPQKAVAPGYRVSPGEATSRQIKDRNSSWPPLGADWQPMDKGQVRRLKG